MIGKDILRQHAIYWPAMLMAAGIEPPTQVWAHGFLTVGGKKMSKTNATGIHPFELIDASASTPTGGTSSGRSSSGRTARSRSSRWWTATTPSSPTGSATSPPARWRCSAPTSTASPEPTFAGAESDLPEVVATAVRRYDEEMLAVRPTAALAAVYDVVVRANRYMVERSPWTLAKDPARRMSSNRSSTHRPRPPRRSRSSFPP